MSDINPIHISNGIASAAEQATITIEDLVSRMSQSGMSQKAIFDQLISDLDNNGPLFGAFKNKVKSTVRDGIEINFNQSADQIFENAGVQEYRWVAGSNGKPCPDCALRHGEVGTMQYFEAIGKPCSGFSVCGSACKCKLIPVDYTKEDVTKPISDQSKKVIVAESWQDAVRINQKAMLSTEDRHFLDIYTNVSSSDSKWYYKIINTALRTGKGLDELITHQGKTVTVKKAAEQITRTLKKNQIATFRGDVHRGVRHRGKEQYDRFTENFRNKKQWTNTGFMSTSTDSMYAESFIEDLEYSTKMRIKSKSGKFIDELTSNDMGEREVLFHPGKKYRVVKFEEDLDGWNRAFVELEEI